MSAENIEELFSRTRIGDYDGDAPWEAVRALRRVGSREVFTHAGEWCKSSDPLCRARGIDVLAQLGKTIEHPSNVFPEECYSIVSDLVQRETDIRPLASAIFALGHLDNPLAITLIADYGQHPSAEIRFAVACALGSFPNDGRSASVLLVLTQDTDGDVRDWATFGLGSLSDLDSTEIRDALVRRLADSKQEAREEAIAGLAKRHDQRVLPSLIAALERPPATVLVTEAARLMLDMENDGAEWSAQAYAAALCERFGLKG